MKKISDYPKKPAGKTLERIDPENTKLKYYEDNRYAFGITFVCYMYSEKTKSYQKIGTEDDLAEMLVRDDVANHYDLDEYLVIKPKTIPNYKFSESAEDVKAPKLKSKEEWEYMKKRERDGSFLDNEEWANQFHGEVPPFVSKNKNYQEYVDFYKEHEVKWEMQNEVYEADLIVPDVPGSNITREQIVARIGAIYKKYIESFYHAALAVESITFALYNFYDPSEAERSDGLYKTETFGNQMYYPKDSESQAPNFFEKKPEEEHAKKITFKGSYSKVARSKNRFGVPYDGKTIGAAEETYTIDDLVELGYEKVDEVKYGPDTFAIMKNDKLDYPDVVAISETPIPEEVLEEDTQIPNVPDFMIKTPRGDVHVASPTVSKEDIEDFGYSKWFDITMPNKVTYDVYRKGNKVIAFNRDAKPVVIDNAIYDGKYLEDIVDEIRSYWSIEIINKRKLKGKYELDLIVYADPEDENVKEDFVYFVNDISEGEDIEIINFREEPKYDTDEEKAYLCTLIGYQIYWDSSEDVIAKKEDLYSSYAKFPKRKEFDDFEG